MKGPIKKLVSDDLDLKMQISEKKKKALWATDLFSHYKICSAFNREKKEITSRIT